MKKLSALATLAGLAALLATAAFSQPTATADQRAGFKTAFDAGNIKAAYEGYRKLALDPADDPRKVGEDLNQATLALQQLGRVDEIDALREAVIKIHRTNWRLLWAAADNYLAYENDGFIIAGHFQRGPHAGGGQAVNSMQRDRVRALQLMAEAMPLNRDEPALARSDVADFYLALARMLLANRGYDEAWRLEYLTDLNQLPDYDEGWYEGRTSNGAPVDAEGSPVFYHVPASFEKAANDGERWRWALAQVVEFAPDRLNEARWQLADFLQNQFGVQTMADYGRFFNGPDDEGNAQQTEGGIYSLRRLADDETIARLAIGIKRFKLPAEFDFIKIYRQIADDPKTGQGAEALEQLAQIFENRRQYPQAADYWRRAIKEYGPGQQNSRQQRLAQIEGNWGRFEPVMSQPAGRGATVDFRFRNGGEVSFEAHEINIVRLLGDVKAYLKSNPRALDWQQANVGDIGSRLVERNQKQYVGERVAAWDLKLDPKPDHFDRRITVSTPLQKAGAYLLTARMADGNVSHIIVWLEDTAIVKKPLDEAMFYYVADAATGAPIPKAHLEFFGYRQKQIGNTPQYNVETVDFADATGADGELIRPGKKDDNAYQWLITATTSDGRLAYLGFTNIWAPKYTDAEFNATRVFTITDRPVYRPGQRVKFKFWVRHARYDEEEKSEFANQNFAVEIQNPKGEKIFTKNLTADAYGGLDGEFPLPDDATLGVYQLYVVNYGGGSFRVEEYKKPEYEVTIDAPKTPVMLGEKITATIKARYYFGSPVTKARVKYKVLRTRYDTPWYPAGDWDWLYGPGYWWFAPDCPWYPGWSQWSIPRPAPSWWIGRSEEQPEVVAERQVEIGSDGTVPVEIDTNLAKAIHPDQDHQYTITAEVVDESRRTIVGTGNVLVARKPFKVFAWVDRGYYRVGDVIQADFFAQTLDGKPVEGDGKLSLLQISYRDGRPVETSVRDWNLSTDAQGRARIEIKASAAGPYRLSYKLTDDKKHTVEGAYLLTILGDGFANGNGADFRFNNLELIADKREYEPGQSVNLLVNTDHAGGTVLLFVRPANGVYFPPKMLRLKGKSVVEEIAVLKHDMPNFFVEALTISEGRLYTEVKEIIVPPEQRVLNVAVEPSRDTYKPGQKATVSLKLTDFFGKPFVGTMVVSVYDKAVEYVSGGSNVEEIKAFFWKWRREHEPSTETTLERSFGNLPPPKQTWMQDLGIFGGTVAEDREKGTSDRDSRDNRSTSVLWARSYESSKAVYKSATIPPPSFVGDFAASPNAVAAAPPAKPAAPAPPPQMVQPTVRTQFADTALWVNALATDENGRAEVALDMPENLTTWKVMVWALGHGTKVGQGQAEVVTRKDVIVRMEAPRFFVETDEVVLSAVVHNYLKTIKKVQVVLELPGRRLVALGDSQQEVEVPANGEKRVDWRVKVEHQGEATVRMKALTDEESDAVEQKFPVYVHGMLKMESFAGALRPQDSAGSFAIDVPLQRRVSDSVLEVRYSPTLAGAMVDALPYLADYPYGCTEQTLNRFVPTVVTQKVLIQMGLDLAKIKEKRTNLNAQELGDDRQRAAGWKRYDRNPVFDNDEVRRMVKDGVQRLTEMQLADGGWGWFSGFGEQSYPHTTAVVVHGLQVARQNDVALVPGMLERGVAWLKNYQARQIELLENAQVKPKPKEPWKDSADDLDALVYMVLVDGGVREPKMLEFLYRDRTKISVYAKALYGLALEKQGPKEKEKLAMILQNIEQYVVQDNENQTAYLKLPEDNYWWNWYGSDVEADACYLKLLSRTDPKGELAPRLVKYLLNNRKHATYWNSTRDTSLAIEALADYMKASGEDKPDLTVEVWMDGAKQKEVKITAADLFTFDNKFVLRGDAVPSGRHRIEIKKRGAGPLYYNGYLTNFTLEDFITRAGLEVKVNRKVYKLVPEKKEIKVAGSRGQAVDQRVEKYVREELTNLESLKSGDLVEVELEIDSKNDYEYLVFEDFKGSGFEAADVQSGYNGNALGAYMELRDNRVSFFIRALARGKHSVAYRLRAEIPGQFSLLPARASAMYAPELKGNSDEVKLRVKD